MEPDCFSSLESSEQVIATFYRGVCMTENEELVRDIGFLADSAQMQSEKEFDIKSLAVGLWANFNELSVEEIEDALRDAWRARGLPFNDNAAT